jgi:hypothetical protein
LKLCKGIRTLFKANHQLRRDSSTCRNECSRSTETEVLRACRNGRWLNNLAKRFKRNWTWDGENSDYGGEFSDEGDYEYEDNEDEARGV